MAAVPGVVGAPGRPDRAGGRDGRREDRVRAGFAAELGVLDPVTSPTFTLVHAYEGRLRVYHADLYRLERMAELADLALGELLDDDDAVVLVEWGDVVSAALGAELMTVRLEWVGTDEPDVRLVRSPPPATAGPRAGPASSRRWPPGWQAEPVMLSPSC